MMRQLLLGAAAVAALSSAAFGADLPVRGPAPVYAAPIFSWSGFYLGGHLGAAWQQGSVEAFTPRNGYAGFDLQGLKGSGLIGGMQAGYNLQMSNGLVLGLEADLSAVGISKSTTNSLLVGVVPVFTRSLNWTATLAPRIGYGFGRTLLFAKAGLAAEGFEVSHDQSPLIKKSDTRFGPMVGVGLEYAVTNNLTAKLEYDYMAFGKFNTTIVGAPTIWVRQNGDVHQVKVGVNYLFNSPSAVVAKY